MYWQDTQVEVCVGSQVCGSTDERRGLGWKNGVGTSGRGERGSQGDEAGKGSDGTKDTEVGGMGRGWLRNGSANASWLRTPVPCLSAVKVLAQSQR